MEGFRAASGNPLAINLRPSNCLSVGLASCGRERLLLTGKFQSVIDRLRYCFGDVNNILLISTVPDANAWLN